MYVGFELIYIIGFDGQDFWGHDYIYPILDWKNDPGTAVMWVAIVLAVLIFAHGFLCLLAFVRDKIWERWSGKTIKEEVKSLELAHVKHYDSIKRY